MALPPRYEFLGLIVLQEMLLIGNAAITFLYQYQSSYAVRKHLVI